MKNITYCSFILLILFAFRPNVTAIKPIVSNQLSPAKTVKISGYMGEKLDAAYQNRILAQDVNKLVEPFHNRKETYCWQSEFWGKWFTSAVLAYKYRPEPQLKAKLDQAVAGLMATQTPDGYIGNYAEANRMEQWDIWGRKYCLLGLIDYYDLTKDKKSLQAASKLADHLIKELADKNALLVKKGNHRGMAASSVLEPICLLYARTGNKKYLDFAQEIVKQWESPDGPRLISKAGIPVAERFPKPKNWFGWEQGQKAYEMMSCYEGLLELYRLTGREEYKIAVEKTWESIKATELNIAGSGSSVEAWFGGKEKQIMPVSHYQETCVTATWIKLSQQLLRLTGEAKYADAVEQTYYNALLGAMKPDGSDWAKYTPLFGQRLEGSEQCGMGLNCCVASGPRGLFTLPMTTVMSHGNGVQINFFVPGTYQVSTPKKQAAQLTQETNYPVTGNILVKLNLPKSEEFTLRVRIPGWSTQSILSVNNQEVPSLKAGEFAEIKRSWKSGDVVSLTTDMRGRMVSMGEAPKNIAFVRGPIVLTRDARLGGPDVDESITPIPDKDGFIKLEPVNNPPKGVWMQFQSPFLLESHKEGGNQPVPLLLCDYASAGNTISEESRFRVWIPQFYSPRNH